jgi:Fur family transcriptional regulator, ferric uptake regulator
LTDMSLKVSTATVFSAEQMLKQFGLKKTPVRIGVLNILNASTGPLDVLELLKQLPSSTEPVTVYRTINTFVTQKIIHRVRGEDRSWRYAIGHHSKTPDHQHAHFVCDTCGKVECLPLDSTPAQPVDYPAPPAGYKVLYPEVLLHGMCAKCN